MGDILRIAPSITTPIAFAALALLVVYLVTRQLLQLNVFTNVGQKHSAGIIVRIVNRVFLLALIVSVLVFFFSVMPAVLHYLSGRRTTVTALTPASATEAATKVLKQFYAKDAESIYASLPTSAQQQIRLVGAEKMMQRELFQIPGEPVSRTPPRAEVISGNAIVRSEVEFDQVTNWIEQVNFVSQDDGWRFWSLTVFPARMPNSPADLMPYQSSEQFFASADVASYRDRWVPPPGWKVSVRSIGTQVAKRTCHLSVTDEQSHRLQLLNVLGACTLRPGSEIVFIGRFLGLTTDERSFADVRYYPTI